MQEVTTITFKVNTAIIDNPFNILGDDPVTIDDIKYTSWKDSSVKTADELTILLQDEILNYYINNNLLRGVCEDGETPYVFHKDEDGEFLEVEYEVSPKTCNDHLSHKFQRSISDVLSRDSDAFFGQSNVDLYAIVVLYNDEYYGHIYTWRHNNLCAAIGIRSRIDAVFMRNSGIDSLKNVSSYLLESVRRFATINSCDKIAIPYPLSNMEAILKSRGFNKEKLTHGELGKGPGLFNPRTSHFPMQLVCSNCYTIDLPIDAMAIIKNYSLIQ